MSLADYDRRKFELTEVLRAIAAAGLRPLGGGGDDQVQPLMARLAEDRFNLVVVGRFSRGKSTLMNAILRTDRLPTGVVPLTSVITAVGYGSEELVRLTFQDRLLQSDIPLAELRDYVTQDGNPGNQRRVKLAEILLPAEILRRGFYFVDTPGLGSAIAENTRTTEAFLRAADAFLLVTGFDSPLSAEEDKVLQVIAASRRPLFVAVNKQDTVAPADRDAALDYLRARLREARPEAEPELFSTSAIEAIRAEQAGDAARLEASGVVALEAALIRFLVAEKSRAFLLGMCDRIERLLAATPAAAPSLRETLQAVRAHIEPTAMATEPTIGGLAPIRSEMAETCAICAAMDGACFDFLARFQYDLIVDPALRQGFSANGGFCALHTWRYDSVASPHGECISYPDLTERWAARLADLAQAADGAQAPGAAIRTFLGAPERCPACKVCSETEAAAVAAVAARLGSNSDVNDETAFCLRHLADLLEAVESPSARRALLERQAGLFERVGDDMRRYALKFEALRRPLASRAEERAPGRALRLVAGVPNLSAIRRIED